jgi:hypothetical protein
LPLDDFDEGTEAQIDLPFNSTPKNGQFRPKINFPSNLGYEDHKTRESTNFKLNSCSIHPSGALLLQESDKSLLGQSLNQSRISRELNTTMNRSQRVVTGFGDSSDDEENEKMDPIAPQQKPQQELQRTPPKNNSSENSRITVASNGFRDDDEDSRKINKNTTQVVVNKKKKTQKKSTTKEVSLWEPLDPHEENLKGKKPFKKSKKNRI